jgi:pimeloyl-ACP methyl ester carboxylesterase
MDKSLNAASSKRPAIYHSILEARVPLEAASLLVSYPLLSSLPHGDGHPVLVVPGLTAGDGGTWALRQFLDGLGYASHAWCSGRNVGPMAGSEKRLLQKVQQLSEQYQAPVSVIGWSMGGLFARYVAHEKPELVRNLITLGSPIGLSAEADNVASLLARVGRNISLADFTNLVDEKSWHHWRRTPPVPTSALYTRTDGACHWSSTMDPLEHDQAENIRVPGSHVGLTHNVLVYRVLADRLAQPLGQWQPYQRVGVDSVIYNLLSPFKLAW